MDTRKRAADDAGAASASGAAAAAVSPIPVVSGSMGPASAGAASDDGRVFFPGDGSKRARSNSWAASPMSEGKSPSSPRSYTPSSDKNNKGLRHFSMKVCQKVKEKGVTTYNEVADELVEERKLAEVLATDVDDGLGDVGEPHGPKNIRRRVYDALNVLMAMNIISKEKKEIKWIGLPNNSIHEYTHMEELRNRKIERIRRKKQHLHELILQSIAFQNLIKRNEERMRAEAAGEAKDSGGKVKLPFVIVNTSKDAAISCQMKPDKSEYFFDFDTPFEIHDDIEVLKRMGLAFGLESGSVSPEDMAKAKSMLPKSLHRHLDEMVAPRPFEDGAGAAEPASVAAS